MSDQLEEWKKEIGEIPDATCPNIDGVIKHINEALKILSNITSRSNSYYKVDTIENAKDYADDAESELEDLEDDLEELRKSNEQLRALGEFWYEKCKELLSRQTPLDFMRQFSQEIQKNEETFVLNPPQK